MRCTLCAYVYVCERARLTHTHTHMMHLTQIRVYKCSSSSADRMHGAGSQCDASFSRPIHPPTRTKYVLNAPLPYVHYVFCSCVAGGAAHMEFYARGG
jgi:hypothetical protein